MGTVRRSTPGVSHRLAFSDTVTVTNYFVVTRLTGSDEAKRKGVRGPMSKEEFDRLFASMHLPPFNKTFADLE